MSDHFGTLCIKGLRLMYHIETSNLAGIHLFKVNKGNTRTMREICSKLTIKTPEQLQ